MKQLFGEQIFDLLKTPDGFITVYRRPEFEDGVVVSYKSVSLDDGVVTQRTRADYEFIKFGANCNLKGLESGGFITCSCVELDKDRIFIVRDGGEAAVYDAQNNIEWQGTVRYKDEGPSSIAGSGDVLWASFAENNTLIRFNLRTMREELRIGGSNDSSFSGPCGIWLDDSREKLFVCNCKAQNILEVNVKTYTVAEHAAFEEPVHKYLRLGNRELVVLDSGLYLL